jgi:hypothetical protein
MQDNNTGNAQPLVQPSGLEKEELPNSFLKPTSRLRFVFKSTPKEGSSNLNPSDSDLHPDTYSDIPESSGDDDVGSNLASAGRASSAVKPKRKREASVGFSLLQKDPRCRKLCAPEQLICKRKSRKLKRLGASHAVAGSNSSSSCGIENSLSMRLSEGYRVACDCCISAQQSFLSAMAPLVLRVHELLTDNRAQLSSSVVSTTAKLHELMLTAYGGGALSSSERTKNLMFFFASELLHRRCTVAIRQDDTLGAYLDILVSSQKARLRNVSNLSQSGKTRECIAVPSRSMSTRTAAGVIVRRVWSSNGDHESESSDEECDVADYGNSYVTNHGLQAAIVEKPVSNTTALDPTYSIVVRLVDVSELTPVPEKMQTPVVTRYLPACSEILHPEDLKEAPHMNTDAANLVVDVSSSDPQNPTVVVDAEVPHSATPLHSLGLECPLKSAAKSPVLGRSLRKSKPPSAIAALAQIQGGDLGGRLVFDASHELSYNPTSIIFTQDDAMRHMLRIGYTAPITLKDLPDRGRCVFSEGFIPQGAFIVEYAGQIISHKVAKDRETQYRYVERSTGSYMFFFTSNGRGHCIDATAERPVYGIGRLISHSRKNPSCFPKRILVDGVPRLALIAARDIMFGEELLYNYGDTSAVATKSFVWLKE